MDFLDPNKKRAHRLKLMIGYGLMSIAIGLGAVILLYAAYGYGVDRSGNLFQNGLVFVASTPDSAEVIIKNNETNQSQKALTAQRLVLPSGTYNFEFLKEGYRPWQRTIQVRGGGVKRLTYPFLFPEKLEPSDIALYAKKPEFATLSPDRSVIVVQHPDDFSSFDVYDTSDTAKNPSSFKLAPNLLTKATKNQSLELVEWASDNRHLLVKHTFDNKSEFVVIDRQSPNSSVNINKAFALTPKDVSLRDKNSNLLYILNANNELVSANISEDTLASVAKNIIDFESSGGDTILYIATSSTVSKNSVGVFVREGTQTYTVRELPKSESYLLGITRYSDNWLVAAGATNDNRVYVYRNPVTFIRANNPDVVPSVRTMKIDKPTHLSFSENSQFILLQNGQTFNTYDAGEDKQYHFTIDTKFTKNSGPASWMNGHRILTLTGGRVTVFDFDGSNYQLLSASNAGIRPMFDSDYKRLITVAPSVTVKNRSALVETPLRVEN